MIMMIMIAPKFDDDSKTCAPNHHHHYHYHQMSWFFHYKNDVPDENFFKKKTFGKILFCLTIMGRWPSDLDS